eukprot:6193088-Pleurochrysis_carterae.AAC.4
MGATASSIAPGACAQTARPDALAASPDSDATCRNGAKRTEASMLSDGLMEWSLLSSKRDGSNAPPM